MQITFTFKTPNFNTKKKKQFVHSLHKDLGNTVYEAQKNATFFSLAKDSSTVLKQQESSIYTSPKKFNYFLLPGSCLDESNNFSPKKSSPVETVRPTDFPQCR